MNKRKSTSDKAPQDAIHTSVPKEVLSVRDTAHYLGISESILRRLVRQNTIPFIRLGGLYKFYLPTLQSWLAKMTTVPPNGITTSSASDPNRIADIIWSETTKMVS